MRSKSLMISIAIVFAGGLAVASAGQVFASDQMVQKKKAGYHCPMHPDFVSDKKGTCGICGMDLVKDEEDDSPAARSAGEMGTVPGVMINTNKQQLIGVKKDTVTKRPLTLTIATVGKVAYDPDLYVAQEEYVQALKTAAQTQKSALVSIREQSAALLAASERNLLLLGMSRKEVDALKENAQPQDGLYFPGKSGKAWIYLTVYEYEMGSVKEGQAVAVDAVAFPGEVFPGNIVGLTPVLNAESRSVRVRAEVEDKDGKLKPEMFVNAKIAVDLGVALSIPEEALMDSGTRKIVYVVKDDHFAAREVTVGPKVGEYYKVLSGLEEGEEVVTSGNFLIDSESKLKGAL